MIPVLITGMFRSGTTLMSKLLTFHPNIMMAGDAGLFFFRHFRNHWYEQAAKAPWKPDDPMSSGFLDANWAAERAIAASDLGEALDPEARSRLAGDIDSTTLKHHPDLVERLGRIRADTFRDFFSGVVDLMVATYGRDQAGVTHAGMKMAWLEAFVPALSRAFPEMKFVLMMRDVRAIVASQNSKGETRPLLFYARNWRKSVAYAHHLARCEETASRVLLLQYESLVADPERTMRGVCDFLGVDYSEEMLNLDRNVDERGERWAPNTSYGSASGFFTSSVSKWKEQLSPREIRMLDYLCGPELRLMGYEAQCDDLPVAELLAQSAEPDYDTLVDWIRDTADAEYLRDRTRLVAEMAKERLRRSLLACDDKRVLEDDDLVARLFIFRDAFVALQDALGSATAAGT